MAFGRPSTSGGTQHIISAAHGRPRARSLSETLSAQLRYSYNRNYRRAGLRSYRVPASQATLAERTAAVELRAKRHPAVGRQSPSEHRTVLNAPAWLATTQIRIVMYETFYDFTEPALSAAARRTVLFRQRGAHAGHRSSGVRPGAGRGFHRHHRRGRCRQDDARGASFGPGWTIRRMPSPGS